MTYRITFMPMDRTVEVDPTALEEPRDGLRGSILQLALENHIDLDHACGGIAACSTCHVIVSEGGASIPDAEDDEEDMLDSAPGLTLDSRLACQAVPDGSTDLVVEIPDWNRNQVKE
ncbi:MAG: 2Fe-2S iron-sulfur cluster-binding protein [Planctomycetota bacterium]|jgi:2Fe-2S ferredoxin